jgi:hypothetical protein
VYRLGDVPLILQGAGQREQNLTPQQRTTLAAEGGILPASGGIPTWLVFGALGLVGAVALVRAQGRRSW